MGNLVRVGPDFAADSEDAIARGGLAGEMILQTLHGRYYEQSARGSLFIAHAQLTAPVIYTTAAGTGGPLIWNGSPYVNVVILAVTVGHSIASTVSGAIGLTGNTNQFVAPTSTTAITSSGNGLVSTAHSRSTAYAKGTVVRAGGFFFPLFSVTTGAITTISSIPGMIDVGGAVVCPPYSWVAISASATLTTGAFALGLIYEEVPV